MLAGSCGPICRQATSGSVAATFDKKVAGSGLGCLQLCQLSSFKIQLVLLAQHVQFAQNWTPPYLRHWLGLRRLVNITMVISFQNSLVMPKSCPDMSQYFHIISQNSLCYKPQSWRLCSWGLRASCSRLPCGPCVETAPKHCTHQPDIPCILLRHASASAATCDKRIATENSPRIASTRTQSGNARYTLRLCYTFNRGRLHVFAEAHAVFCYPFTLLPWQEFSLLRISLILPELWATHYLPKKPFRFQHSSLPSKAAAYLLLWLEAQGGRMNASVPS